MELLDFALRRYSLVAVDLPGTMQDQECETLLRAKRIYLVCTPDIGALHVARGKASWLKDLRLTDKVAVVLNSAERRSTLSIDDIQRIIQLPVRHFLPHGAPEIARAVQKGTVLDASSGLGKHIARIAEEMACTAAPRRSLTPCGASSSTSPSAPRATLNIESGAIVMTNQTMLGLLDYLCNEARNSVHATFGLMALWASPVADPGWRTCLENSKSSADRLLRSIDDIRELLVADGAGFEPAEEFDLTLCLGEIVDVLNLVSGDRGSRLVLESAARAVGRQPRRAVEQALTRILDAAAKLGQRGEVRVSARLDPAGAGVRFEIVPANSNIALRLADWLNADLEQLNFQDADDLLFGIPTMVAGKRLRALGGVAEFVSDVIPMALRISLPWSEPDEEDHAPETVQEEPASLIVLVAEDSDESFALTGILLNKESVWRARDGHEAVHMMKNRRFDVVLMDIHMPGLDGYKAIHAMRDWETQTGNARTPIVVLSSDDIDTQMRSAAQSGCSGFLRKPLDRHDMGDLLDRLKTARSVPACIQSRSANVNSAWPAETAMYCLPLTA